MRPPLRLLHKRDAGPFDVELPINGGTLRAEPNRGRVDETHNMVVNSGEESLECGATLERDDEPLVETFAEETVASHDSPIISMSRSS